MLGAVVAQTPRPQEPRRGAPGALRRDFAEALRLAATDRPIRRGLALTAALSFSVLAVLPLLPVVAGETLGGGPRELGLLLGSAGFGAFLATLRLAGRADLSGWSRQSALSCLVAGLGLGLLAFAPWRALAYLAMALAGFGAIQVTTGTNALLQSRVEERMRGRIVSLFVLAFSGASPLGSLALGAAAHAWGIRTALTASAGLALATGAFGDRRLRNLSSETLKSGRKARTPPRRDGVLVLKNIPKGIRTPAGGLKTRCPRPLDDGDAESRRI